MKDAYTNKDDYHKDLAMQIATYLTETLKNSGGLMAVSDAYCRVNRARGVNLLSPDDFQQACALLKMMDLPVKLRKFESGVYVLQLQTQTDEEIDKSTLDIVKTLNPASAEDLAKQLGISVILAKERLLSSERIGLTCRDDSVEGLFFYPNLFLSES
uniref:Vacuolar protein-sorting-associated protein 36 n=1 Tax=Lynceus sp. MCZ IZ 141354 TaxID=1930659 RepID=A0A9N6WRC2_9CRUS|nr:EOG090X09MN [Lynceus sp. MCZ IZ 141354]